MPVPSVAEMLRELIGSPSVSCTQPDIDQSNLGVIHKLADWLADLGFSIDIETLPDQPEKANLIATLGTGPGGLILGGHTDTVPFNASLWRSDPFSLTERDGAFYGLGTCDMKAFFALAIEAARSRQGMPMKAPLCILATADEESTMGGARRLVELGKPRARFAVIGEPTEMRPVYAHKGIMMMAISVAGRSGHSSNPQLGCNALDAMHDVMGDLLTLRRELAASHRNPGFDVDVPTLNLGCLHAGDNPNRICGHAELQIDLRVLPGMDTESILGEIDQRLAVISERHGAPVERQLFYPPIPAFECNRQSDIVTTCETLTGQKAGTVAFGTEGPFLQALGTETLILGPGSIDQAHQPDEFLRLDSINPCVDLLGQLIDRYCLQGFGSEVSAAER